MKKLKKPLLFTLVLLPLSVVAVIFTCLYQFDLYPPEVMSEAVAQVGSEAMVMLVSVAQSTLTVLVTAFFGYIFAEKTGLLKPFKSDRKKLTVTFWAAVIMGVIFSLDYWIFGGMISGVQEATKAGLTLYGVLASVLYGGIIEEVMLRLFFMSALSLIIWKIFCRKFTKENIPTAVFVIANVIASLAFAAGHLPATVMTFGTLTPLILVRCFLFNGGFGFVFGELYRRYGIGYAMIAHVLTHIVSKIVWLIFV